MLLYSLSSLMVFSIVVKHKSFSRAADILFMTQPGVSNHIANLEAQTGLELIKRGRGRFELTKEGRNVYRYAERIEKLSRELEEKVRSLRGDSAPMLRIGTTINYGKRIMPYVLGAFNKEAPDIRIKLDTGSSTDMEKTLISGENDVIIVANQHRSNKIQSYPFVKEELIVIVARNHPLASKRAVSLTDIRPYPFIIREEGSATRGVILSAFQRKNITPSVLIEVKSAEFIKEWVSQGKGVSILIQRAMNSEDDAFITTVPLVEPLFLEVSVLFLKSKKYDRSIQRFIGYLKELTLNPDPRAALIEAKEREEARP